MTKKNVTDFIIDIATCSTMNDIDIDVASNVADDTGADVASNAAADVANDVAADVAANMANDVACLILGPFWKWAVTMGQFSAHYKSTQIEYH
jgi:hypothetical protein